MIEGRTYEKYDANKEYWYQKFNKGFHKISFPEDLFNPTAVKKFEEYNFVIPKDIFCRVAHLSNNSDKRLLMVLASALAIQLSKYTNDQDITIGTSILNKEFSEDYINTILPLRTWVKDDFTYKDYILSFRKSLLEAEENQNFAMSNLFLELGKGFVNGYYPLFNVGIILDNVQNTKFFENIQIDFVMFFSLKDEELTCKIRYNSSCYSLKYLKQIKNHYINNLYIISNSTDVIMKDINFLSAEERNEILLGFNTTEFEKIGNKSFLSLYNEVLAMHPDRAAIEFHGESLTYYELDILSSKVAVKLQEHGAGCNTIIALFMEKSLEFIIGLLGVIKSGAAYLPIDTIYPDDRVDYMLEESQALLTLTSLKNEVIPSKGKVLRIEELYLDTKLENYICQDNIGNLAYIIYTSGSTGKPKGVMISHRSLSNYIQWANHVYSDNKSINMPLYSSISFDLTVTSIFLPLLTGGTIHIYNGKNTIDVIKSILEDNRLNIMKLTPSHLELVKSLNINQTTITKFIVGGEDLKSKLALEIQKKYNNVSIFNEYGPTEATVGCMIHRYNNLFDSNPSVPIGTPAANTQIYILDNNLNPVPRGVIGQIYIGGNSVSKGYINNPDVTNEKFIKNPFNDNSKIYATGDLAKMNLRDQLEYIGRTDTQVKIRGYRIELSEIENTSLEFACIDEVVVMVRGHDDNKIIVAFIVGEVNINIEDYLNFLRKKLPSYMIPNKAIQINEMPKTDNGKVDRLALSDINSDSTKKIQFIEPRNDVEKGIAKIWGEVLLIKNIGIDDEFFDLGGNSIKAMIVTDKINSLLSIQMQVVDMFDNPTIRRLTSRLLDINSESYKPVMKLNEDRMDNIFVFPPMAGLGIAYKDLASKINSHTVYAFDFIEEPDRVSQYINLITDIQPSGSYQLLAYSSGGLLLYEVALELEHRGYVVENIILVDCVSDKKCFTLEEKDNLINQELSSLREAMMIKYPARWKYVEESVERRIRAFMNYISEFKNRGQLNAFIHQIRSNSPDEDTESSNSKAGWDKMTKTTFISYVGYGTHIEMLVKYLSDNAEIINTIVETYTNRDRRLYNGKKSNG